MSITTGVGLISGLDISSIVDQLMSIEARPKTQVENQNVILQAQQTAYQTINAKLLAVKSAAAGLSQPLNYRKTTGSSSNEAVLGVAVSDGAIPGNHTFRIRQLVSAQQTLSAGQTSKDQALGLSTSFTFDRGQAKLSNDVMLEDLNGGAGIERGMVRITDRSGSSELIDLSDVVTMEDVVEEINSAVNINVRAAMGDQGLVLTDDTGLTISNLRVQNVGLTETATSLGIEQSVASDTLSGNDVVTLGRKSSLKVLNDGNGVGQKAGVADFRITDQNGDTYDVNLDDVDNLGELFDAVKEATDGKVVMQVASDGVSLQLTDTTGGAGTLSVAALNSSVALEDLGLTNAATGATLGGDRVLATAGSKLLKNLNGGQGFAAFGGSTDTLLKSTTQLSTLLGGAGLTTTGDANADLQIQSRKPATLETTTTIAALLGGSGLSTTGDANADLSLQTRDGSTYTVDFDGLTTVQDMIDAVDTATGGNVEMSVSSDGAFSLRDVSGGSGNNFVVADAAGSSVATELGLTLDQPQTTVNGDEIAVSKTMYDVDIDGLSTVQELIDAVATATNGEVVLRISGNQLIAEDTTGSTGTSALDLVIQDGAGSSLATELGLVVSGDVSSKVGDDLAPAIADVGAEITFTDSSGASATVDFAGAESVSDLIDAINNAGLGLEASLNAAGNGIQILDTANGTGNLTIADTAGSQLATQLGLVGDFVDGAADSGNLNLGYVQGSSSLTELGVTLGKFTMTDSSGASATVDLTNGTFNTINDVISQINSRGLYIQARVNDAGNGIMLEDTNTGTVNSAMKVTENGSSTAESLGILGTATSAGADLQGSLQVRIDIDPEDTLSDIAQKISNSDANIAASVINDGSGSSPFRLSLTARRGGSGNAFVFDDGGAGLNAFNLSEAQDAVVFMGSGSGSQANSVPIVSGSNTIDKLLPGVTLTLKATTDTPVQANVTEDITGIKETVGNFVTAINELVDIIDEYDAYNADTEERGLLLGDTAINTVKSQILSMVFSRNGTLSQELDSLTEIGVKVQSGGRLSFDETKFEAAFEEDRDAVINLMTLRETVDNDNDGEPDEDDDGKQILRGKGFGVLINEMMTRLTDTQFGPIEAAVDRVQKQIENNEKRIEDLDDRLERKRERLTAEFTQMESILADMQSQSQALAAFQPLQNNSNG